MLAVGEEITALVIGLFLASTALAVPKTCPAAREIPMLQALDLIHWEGRERHSFSRILVPDRLSSFCSGLAKNFSVSPYLSKFFPQYLVFFSQTNNSFNVRDLPAWGTFHHSLERFEDTPDDPVCAISMSGSRSSFDEDLAFLTKGVSIFRAAAYHAVSFGEDEIGIDSDPESFKSGKSFGLDFD
jgi:hypothetical protein